MKQTKTVKEMSVRELQEEIDKRKKQEAIDKFSTKKETEFKISEVETLEAEGNGSLYHNDIIVEEICRYNRPIFKISI